MGWDRHHQRAFFLLVEEDPLRFSRASYRRKDLAKYSDSHLRKWLEKEMVELNAVRSSSANVTFNRFSELDDVINLLLELQARRCLIETPKLVASMLRALVDDPSAAHLFNLLHKVKSSLRSSSYPKEIIT